MQAILGILRIVRVGLDAWLALGAVVGLAARSQRRRGGEAGVFISHGSVEEVRRKFGGDELMLLDDPGGFFGHVYRMHYECPSDRVYRLSDHVTAVDMRVPLGRLRLLHLALAAWRIVELHRRQGVKLIHAHDFYECGLAAWLASRCTGAPFCLTIQQDYDETYRAAGRRAAPAYLGIRRLAKLQERWLVRRAPMVLPIREHLAEYARRQGARPERVRVMPHGVDFRAYELPKEPEKFRRDYGLAAGRRVVAAVGRLSAERYCGDTLDIARRAAGRAGEVVFLMVGGGPEQEGIARRIEEEGLGGVVRMTGFVPREEVARIFRHSDAALCTHGGYSLIEACAAGCPVVAYDVDWHGEMIRDGETGRLVPARDVERAAEAVVDLLERRGQAERMARAARELARRRHSLEAVSRLRREQYEELLAPAGRGVGR